MAAELESPCVDMDMVRERIRLMTSPQVTTDQLVFMYNRWASNYEKDLSFQGKYSPPQIGADTVAALLGNKKEAAILDAATGTGLVGLHLHELGFRNLHGLDASSGMLDEARKKNVFTKLICDYLGTNRLNIEDGAYDVVVMVGGFASNGHVKQDCLPEIIRIIKPGGYFVNVIGENCLTSAGSYRGTLEPAMEALERDGKWCLVKRQAFPRSYREEAAVLFLHRKQ